MKPRHLLIIVLAAVVLAGIAVVATTGSTAPTGDQACKQSLALFESALAADARANQTPVVNPESSYWDFTQSPGPGLDALYPKYISTKSTQWAYSFDATARVTKVVFRSDNRPDTSCGV